MSCSCHSVIPSLFINKSYTEAVGFVLLPSADILGGFGAH